MSSLPQPLAYLARRGPPLKGQVCGWAKIIKQQIAEGHANTAAQQLRRAVSSNLNRLARQDPARADYQEKFKSNRRVQERLEKRESLARLYRSTQTDGGTA